MFCISTDSKKNDRVDSALICQQQINEKTFGNLRLEKFEREQNNLKEKRLNDHNLIIHVSNQVNALLNYKELSIKQNKNITSELNALKLKHSKVERKHLHYIFTNSHYFIELLFEFKLL